MIDKNQIDEGMSYEDAHKELDGQDVAKPGPADEEVDKPEPAVSAVKAAYNQQRDEDAKAFSEAFNTETTPVASGDVKVVETAPAKPVKFGDAFKAAAAKAKANPNDKSLRVFEFNGKRYTTDLAKSKAAKPAAKVAEPVTDGAIPFTAPGAETKAKPKAEPKSIYDDNTFPKNAINAVKSAMKSSDERKVEPINTAELKRENQKGMGAK